MSNNETFRVIIVGGGPVALVAGHALAKAGMDYIILERRKELDVDSGASVAIWPHNVRILDQLGLLEEAESLYMPVKNKRNLRRDGSLVAKSNMMEAIGINHGHIWMCFHRAKLVNMLYQRLPENKAHVLLDKEVTSISSTDTNVTVTCADKSTYTGAVVLGADGVHSTVRALMNESQPNSTENQKNPFTACYRGLYGYASKLDTLEPEMLYETHADGLTIQIIVNEMQAHFLVYERLPTPTTERTRFTPDDQEEFAARYADVRFTDQVTFGDIWNAKRWSAIGNLEEGIVPKWHEGRCVLVGDAAHKMTPNSGFGMNSGLQGVVQIVNRLRSLTQTQPEPSSARLTKVFEEYQASRMKNSKEAVDVSGLYTRIVAWNNLVWKLADQYVMPYVGGDITALNLLMAPIVKKGDTLEFLEEKKFKTGKVAWGNGRRTLTKEIGV